MALRDGLRYFKRGFHGTWHSRWKASAACEGQPLKLRNYKRRGVWVWLKGRTCFGCGGKGGRYLYGAPGMWKTCSRCNGKAKRGYQRILSEPKQVIAEQEGLAEGVMG